MARTSDRKQHLNVRTSQMEMTSRGSVSPISEDITGKLQEAQIQLDLLQQQKEEAERQKKELEELNLHREDFLQGQIELNERLNTVITAMDRQIFSMRQEVDELEQARTCFVDHLQKIDQLNPDQWSNESLSKDLSRAVSVLDLADDEYEQAEAHFANTRSAVVFGLAPSKSRRNVSLGIESDMMTHFRNGFAYNFPLVLLGIIAMIVYLLK